MRSVQKDESLDVGASFYVGGAGKTDAGSGTPSPTQTGQRSGERIVKRGMQTIGYRMWYFARSGEPSRAASLNAGFPLH